MIHRMNTKWETECGLLEPARDAQYLKQYLTPNLTRLLEQACSESMQADFRFTAEHHHRQLGT